MLFFFEGGPPAAHTVPTDRSPDLPVRAVTPLETLSLMQIVLQLAEVQYVRRGHMRARLPATRLALQERALRAELTTRGVELARPRASEFATVALGLT